MIQLFRKLGPILMILMVIPALCDGQILGLTKAPDPVRFWITNSGEPWAFVTQNALFLKQDSGYMHLKEIQGVRQAVTSPNGNLVLLAQHEPYHSRLAQSIHTHFVVMNHSGSTLFEWDEDNAADETRWQSAIRNAGFLALIDPGYARFKLIAPNGKIVVEQKLIKNDEMAENTSVFNLERKGRIGWIGNRVFVVLEKRAFQAEHAANVELFVFNSTGEGVGQNQFALTQIQGALFDDSGIFVAGYDWSDTDTQRSFRHELIRVNPEETNDRHQWGIPAKSMSVSPNGRWLAVLGDSEQTFRINLRSGKLEKFRYKSDSEFIHDLAINNEGTMLGLIVGNANYHPLEIFKNNQIKFIKLVTDEIFEVKTSGVYQDQLHLETDGTRFYLGDSQLWREVSQ